MQPGLPEAEIRALAAARGLEVPDEIVELYSAFDGQAEYSDGILFGGILLGWEVALMMGEVAQDVAATVGDQGASIRTDSAFDTARVRQVAFDPHWVPITDDQGGSLLCVDLAPSAEGAAGQVIRAGYWWSDRRLVAPTPRALLERLIELAESGEFGMQEDLRPLGGTQAGFLPDFGSIESALDHVRQPFVPRDQVDIENDWVSQLDPRWQAWFASKPEGFATRLRTTRTWKPRAKDGPDLEPVRWMPDLQELDLSRFPIASIEAIPDIPKLGQLTLGRVPSLSGIERFGRLARLNLTVEQEWDLTPLGQLPNFFRVWAKGFVLHADELQGRASVAVDVTVASLDDIDRAIETPRLGWLTIRAPRDLDVCAAAWSRASEVTVVEIMGGRVEGLRRLDAPRLSDLTLTGQSRLDLTDVAAIEHLGRIWLAKTPTDVIAVDALRHLPPRVHVYAQELLGVWDYSSGDAQL